MKDPYLYRVNTDFYKETGMVLSFPNLQILARVRKYEQSNNYEDALHMLITSKQTFPKVNTKTIWNEEFRIRKLIIDKLILCGRYEEAALSYESIGMWKEAGDTRRMSKTVKNVNVDVNQLIESVKYSGLGLQYKCNNCGASLKIENPDVGRIKHCAFCGASIDTEAMIMLLKETLK
jgi:hypothetical protein